MIPRWVINIKLFFAAVFVFLTAYKINNKHQRNKGKQEEQAHNTVEEFEAYKRKMEREKEVITNNQRITRKQLFDGLRAYADKNRE